MARNFKIYWFANDSLFHNSRVVDNYVYTWIEKFISLFIDIYIHALTQVFRHERMFENTAGCIRIHDESRCFFREKGTQWLHRISAIVRARSIERSPASSPWSLFIAIIGGSPIVPRNLRPCSFRGKIFKFSQPIREQCFVELGEYLTRAYIALFRVALCQVVPLFPGLIPLYSVYDGRCTTSISPFFFSFSLTYSSLSLLLHLPLFLTLLLLRLILASYSNTSLL